MWVADACVPGKVEQRPGRVEPVDGTGRLHAVGFRRIAPIQFTDGRGEAKGELPRRRLPVGGWLQFPPASSSSFFRSAVSRVTDTTPRCPAANGPDAPSPRPPFLLFHPTSTTPLLSPPRDALPICHRGNPVLLSPHVTIDAKGWTGEKLGPRNKFAESADAGNIITAIIIRDLIEC